MIRLATLPFHMKEEVKENSVQQKGRRRKKRRRRNELCLLIFVAFLVNCYSTNLSVEAVGPHCNQVGHGPEDIIMASGRINPKYTWYKRGHKTYVPIVMDPTYSDKEHSIIVGGLDEIQRKTCVEFEYYEDEHSLHGKDYVYITKQTNRGCWSYIGRIGRGKQEIGLPPGCITHRTSMHEMMHALGFRHEHVRHDRDDYIVIFWSNIKRGRESNFQKRASDNSVGPYDYDSIMHYERKAFSKNKMDTIRPLKPGVKIGVRQKMSHWDAKKINIMYGCHAGGGGGGHLSWSPEHDHHDLEHDDLIDSILPRLPTNASSSPPSSAEIEVAYDDLDYDPGSVGPRRESRGRYNDEDDFPTSHEHGHHSTRNYHGPRNDRRGFFAQHHDNHHNNEPGNDNDDYHPDDHNSNNHNPNESQQEEESGPGGPHHHHNEYSPHQPQSYHPQSYSIFDLDTYPGDASPLNNNDAGNSAGISGETPENVDFYDI